MDLNAFLRELYPAPAQTTKTSSHRGVDFLEQFDGTPLHAQAIALCEEELALRTRELEERIAQNTSGSDSVWDAQARVQLKKDALEIELHKMHAAAEGGEEVEDEEEYSEEEGEEYPEEEEEEEEDYEGADEDSAEKISSFLKQSRSEIDAIHDAGRNLIMRSHGLRGAGLGAAGGAVGGAIDGGEGNRLRGAAIGAASGAAAGGAIGAGGGYAASKKLLDAARKGVLPREEALLVARNRALAASGPIAAAGGAALGGGVAYATNPSRSKKAGVMAKAKDTFNRASNYVGEKTLTGKSRDRMIDAASDAIGRGESASTSINNALERRGRRVMAATAAGAAAAAGGAGYAMRDKQAGNGGFDTELASGQANGTWPCAALGEGAKSRVTPGPGALVRAVAGEGKPKDDLEKEARFTPSSLFGRKGLSAAENTASAGVSAAARKKALKAKLQSGGALPMPETKSLAERFPVAPRAPTSKSRPTQAFEADRMANIHDQLRTFSAARRNPGGAVRASLKEGAPLPANPKTLAELESMSFEQLKDAQLRKIAALTAEQGRRRRAAAGALGGSSAGVYLGSVVPKKYRTAAMAAGGTLGGVLGGVAGGT